MSANLISVVLLSVAFAAQAAPPTTPQAGTTKPPAQSAAARPGSLMLTVSSESGQGLGEARVAVHGPADRAGSTGADGVIVLTNMPPGNYRCRITRDGFVALDKELTIRPGARTTTEGVLSPAPAPPPPPPPPPVEPKPSATPVGTPGVPRALSIAELADQMVRELKDTQPIIEREIGCSFQTSSHLIVARENIAVHHHADADEVLYILAGEATLSLGDKDQIVSAGWFGLAPRGTAHSFTRRGRSPIAILSVRSGAPCSGSSGSQVLGFSGSH